MICRAPGSSRKFRRLFFSRREKSAGGRGWIFRRKKTAPVSEALRGGPGGFFFRGPAGPGRGWIFFSRAGTGLDFFFRGAAGLGTGLDFFFGTGLDFSLLEQPAEPRSKDFLKEIRSQQ